MSAGVPDSLVPLSRRGVLRAGLLVPVVALPVAACTSDADTPDPLIALAESAAADAEQARAIAERHPDLSGAGVVARARTAQAGALRKEIDREAGEPTRTRRGARPQVPGDANSAGRQLNQALRAAQQQAAELVPTLPRYRAGLVGSVSAGCASLRAGLA